MGTLGEGRLLRSAYKIAKCVAGFSGPVGAQTCHLLLGSPMSDTLPTEPTGRWLVKVAKLHIFLLTLVIENIIYLTFVIKSPSVS